MNERINRLINLNAKLDKVIAFQDDDEEERRKNALIKAGVGVGALGAAGAAGLYTAGARRMGVNWGNLGSKVQRDIARGGVTGAGGLGSTFVRGAQYAGRQTATFGKTLGRTSLEFLKRLKV